MIALENLRVTFHPGTSLEKPVLRDLSLNINQGEFVTIIGGNGAGKTTLLSAITGDVPLTSGKIFFDNIEVTRTSSRKRAAYIARVFQDPLKGSCANLTVEENLALALKRGQPRGLGLALCKQRREQFYALLTRLGLGVEHHLKVPIGALSGGQRQAIALMMAVLSPSKILLLDEHTAALDPRTAASIIHLTREIIAEKDLTTLMITHSMHQALEVGDRTVMLANGTVVYDVKGKERANLTPHDLLGKFEELALQ
jgi:ABC-type uncharacterized transport system, ATPase component